MTTFIINGRFVGKNITGVQRYAHETVSSLSFYLDDFRLNESVDMEVISPRSSSGISFFRSTVSELFSGHIWEQLILPFSKRGIIINLCNTCPLLIRRQILVIHDASIYAAPYGYTKKFILFYKFLYFCIRWKTSVFVLTDSEFSKQEIARYTGINKSRITVAYCGADHWNNVVADRNILDRLGLNSKRYLLAVSSRNPNKNVDRLIAAHGVLNRLDIPLILVGGSNNRVFADARQSSAAGVLQVGYVSDSELAALYASATAFVFPSLYEGFGLPPLEAMFFGCPVISSREASLPEVCGDAALYCDARNVQSIADAMQKVLDNPDLRRTLILSGSRQVQKFKWQNTAKAVFDLARTIV